MSINDLNKYFERKIKAVFRNFSKMPGWSFV